MSGAASGKQSLIGSTLAGLVRLIFAGLRLLGPDRASALGGFLARALGPLLPVHRKTGRANLAAAFPEKSHDEREAILNGAWDNLGRTVAEYPFLPELVDYDRADPARPARTEIVGAAHFDALAQAGGPAVIFSLHSGNWEMAGVAAAKYGLDAAIVFRPPNSAAAGRAVEEFRSRAMGRLIPSGFGAGAAIDRAMEEGGIVAMLVDQHFTLGIATPFFGRPAATNPLLIRLARKYDCPVHGARCVRLPNGRFRLEMTPPLDLPRDDAGRIDVAGAVAKMNAVIEGWVREAPEQWLWLHRRWREPRPPAATPPRRP